MVVVFFHFLISITQILSTKTKQLHSIRHIDKLTCFDKNKKQELNNNINTLKKTHKRYTALSYMAKLCKVFSQLTCVRRENIKSS